jgi:hypothetical protein
MGAATGCARHPPPFIMCRSPQVEDKGLGIRPAVAALGLYRLAELNLPGIDFPNFVPISIKCLQSFFALFSELNALSL